MLLIYVADFQLISMEQVLDDDNEDEVIWMVMIWMMMMEQVLEEMEAKRAENGDCGEPDFEDDEDTKLEDLLASMSAGDANGDDDVDQVAKVCRRGRKVPITERI